MWYVCDVLYLVLDVRVNCFVVRGCAVSGRYTMFAIVMCLVLLIIIIIIMYVYSASIQLPAQERFYE